MKNFKKLSREELRNVSGGTGCSLVMQQADGSYKTYSGTCKTKSMGFGAGAGAEYLLASYSYCDIGNGVAYPLSSNGGESRC